MLNRYPEWDNARGVGTTQPSGVDTFVQVLPANPRRKMICTSFNPGTGCNWGFGGPYAVSTSPVFPTTRQVTEVWPMVDFISTNLDQAKYRDFGPLIQESVWVERFLTFSTFFVEYLHDAYVKCGGHDAPKYMQYFNRCYTQRLPVSPARTKILDPRPGRVVLHIAPYAVSDVKLYSSTSSGLAVPFVEVYDTFTTYFTYSDYGPAIEGAIYIETPNQVVQRDLRWRETWGEGYC